MLLCRLVNVNKYTINNKHCFPIDNLSDSVIPFVNGP